MYPSNNIIKKKEGKKTGKPSWLKKKLHMGGEYQRVKTLVAGSNLHTVCQEANCPNMFECFSKQTSTFMILGSQCTRHCRFCNVTSEMPAAVDPDEPRRVANAIKKLGLTYVVITSVTRDDLEDGGAGHFAKTIKAIKNDANKFPALQPICPKPIQVEVLIPDFQGSRSALKTVVHASPDVLNHNIETVPSLYSRVRPEANYQQSLAVLKHTKQVNHLMPVKSGIMVGLGETQKELELTLSDLFSHGCDILTIGQYLQPTKSHLPVEKYYSPDEFKQLEHIAKKMGFKQVAAGPFVRSSYNACDLFRKMLE
ncbi:MAG: lipoyl synthase [Pseudomonadota bacterium]